jgi:hypothetical protein
MQKVIPPPPTQKKRALKKVWVKYTDRPDPTLSDYKLIPI